MLLVMSPVPNPNLFICRFLFHPHKISVIGIFQKSNAFNYQSQKILINLYHNLNERAREGKRKCASVKRDNTLTHIHTYNQYLLMVYTAQVYVSHNIQRKTQLKTQLKTDQESIAPSGQNECCKS